MWSKIWTWLKKNWKWLILPLWAISIVLVWLFKGGSKIDLPISGTTDQAADEALAKKDKIIADLRDKLEALDAKVKEMTAGASEEQVKEYEKLRDEALGDIAKWGDDLS